MKKSRSEPSSGGDSEWKKKKKQPCIVLDFVFLSILMISGVNGSGWEEGDDSVNVISVENMDALLGLRMVTELKSFEGVKANETGTWLSIGSNPNDTESETEARSRRMANPVKNPFPTGPGSVDLCKTNHCECLKIGKEYFNVTCDFQNGEINLRPGSVPLNAYEISISNTKKLTILSGTFSNHKKLKKASFYNVDYLIIASLAFQNLTTNSFNLLIEDCNSVNIEEYSFKNLQNPLSVTIADCDNVNLNKSIFHWFTKVQIKNVPNLELMENTFSSGVKQDFETTEAMMLFLNVTINEIPNATFPLSSAKILFLNCVVKTVRSGAFNGIVLVSVSFSNTKLGRLETGAFSERTLIQNVELNEVDIKRVDSNALSAAATFTIQNCRIEEMTNEAFNVNTAYLKVLNNRFGKIRRYAFEIHNWNSIIIRGNHFESLESNFFSAPFSNITTITTEFAFTNNTLPDVEIDVLASFPNVPELDVTIQNNIFENICHCHLETWIRERTGQLSEKFYETSFCVISDLLEDCYNISKGHMKMKEYVEEFCTPSNMIVCKDVQKSYRPNIFVPLDLHHTERTVLGVIFLGVVCSIAIMVSILVIMWVRERSFCGKKRKSQSSDLHPCALFSRLCNNGNLVVSDSISRVNIHEYAEIQNQLNQEQKQTTLLIEDDAEQSEEMVAYENKATQTIPEELTQELIQSLREKLNDPENYNEARDMIEHLYDLIKVEESCNNNNTSPTNSFIFDDDEEPSGGIYEVIQTAKLPNKNSKRKRKAPGIDTVSVGTRAPSPEKLSPINFNIIRPLPTVVSDYVEPRDRKSNEYCEIPSTNFIMPDVLTSSQIKDSNPNSPKTHIYAEPLPCLNRKSSPNKTAQPGTSDS